MFLIFIIAVILVACLYTLGDASAVLCGLTGIAVGMSISLLAIHLTHKPRITDRFQSRRFYFDAVDVRSQNETD